jgi:polysaccharide export outer membrane protein
MTPTIHDRADKTRAALAGKTSWRAMLVVCTILEMAAGMAVAKADEPFVPRTSHTPMPRVDAPVAEIAAVPAIGPLAPTPDAGLEAVRPAPLSPGGESFRCGVRCADDRRHPLAPWAGMRPIPWEAFAQGEYIGPARTAHVPEYRLRVDDQMDFVYTFSVRPTSQPYRLNVRDRIRVESTVAPDVVDRDLLVQPDGTVTLRLLGQVRAAGLTVDEFRAELNRRYARQIRNPTITVSPLEVNSYLQELRYSIDRRYGSTGGQGSQARVAPEGTIQLPIIGSVPVQGLTLGEVRREIESRYEQVVDGVEVTPILVARAPRYFFILGEVRTPGRYTMEGPTTALQALAMAGSWNPGAHLKQVVVLRRDENWCLMATKLNLDHALHGKDPCPEDEIWLRDSDIVIVPKTLIKTADDFIEQVFTRGLYGVVPMNIAINFSKLSTI